jgi:hypothetical protein
MSKSDLQFSFPPDVPDMLFELFEKSLEAVASQRG